MDSEERDPKLDQRLDQWLDDALAGYTAADPRPGLEQRITATLRSEDRAPARRRWWIIFAPAVAALAVLAVTISLHQDRRPNSKSAANIPQVDGYVTPPRQSVPKRDDSVTQKSSVVNRDRTSQAAARASVGRRSERPAPQRVIVQPDPATLAAENKTAPAAADALISGSSVRNDLPQSRAVASLPTPPPAPVSTPETSGSYKISGHSLASIDKMPSPPHEHPTPKTMQTVEVTAAAPAANMRAKSGSPTSADAFDVAAAETASTTTRGYMPRESPLDRNGQFPVPRPLTHEERLMLSVTGTALLQSSKKTDITSRDEALPAIQIREITIKPLQDSDKK